MIQTFTREILKTDTSLKRWKREYSQVVHQYQICHSLFSIKDLSATHKHIESVKHALIANHMNKTIVNPQC